MKRTSIHSSAPVRSGPVPRRAAATLTIIISCTVTVSCIYDTPRGDEFYRTLWKSSEAPLGPFDVSTLTLEFLCNDGISVKTAGTAPDSGETGGDADGADPAANVSRTIYGTYTCNGLTATFRDLTLYLPMNGNEATVEEGQTVEEHIVTFIEAHRNGDTLFLLWKVDGMLYPITTAMHRLSEYE